ncbi:MATE family efflux transporter [Streptomyces olivaceus]|uniref:MATE family efflux transporter n=1 Tax=Streptomyces olivaceus TaxID=47716 RepID=UPI0018855278|nr:MATE family efflux transporter [Streptomyces olivaceus]
MKHTQLTVRNYASYAFVVMLISSTSVGFGAIDLLMVAGKGVEHVAAVGQGDLIVSAVFAFFLGTVDVFGSRLAMAEGEQTSGRQLPVLTGALILLAAASTAVAFALSFVVEPALRLAGQSHTIVPLMGDYISVRLYSVALLIAFTAAGEALKICGMKNVSFMVLLFGFGVNAGLDWLFVYTDCSNAFASPEQAVATATVVAQLLMAGAAITVLLRQLRGRGQQFQRPGRGKVVAEFVSMGSTASGIGVRHLNDWMGAVTPQVFVGTLGVQAVAATAVASKIYTLFARVPQACVSGTFVFYGYEVGRKQTPEELAGTARTLIRYSLLPTALAAVAFLALSPWLVGVFGGSGLDRSLALAMFGAYMLSVPLYIVEANYGEMLTVHQRSGLLSLSSTVITYLVAIPLAAVGVFLLHSPFAAVASCVFAATALVLAVFGRALRRDHWRPVQDPEPTGEVQVA